MRNRSHTRRWPEAEGLEAMSLTVAGAIIGSAALGAISSSMAADKAGDAQLEAGRQASDVTMRQFEQNRTDMAPWREAGAGALSQLTSGLAPGGDFSRDFTLADFTKDPGYQFRMDEGLNALESSAAARGGALGGGALKRITRYGQDYASGEFSNAYNRFNNDRTQRFNRLSGVAGTGQTATRDVANLGSQAASDVSGNIIGAGNVNAGVAVGQANAVNNGLTSLSNFYMQRSLMQPQSADKTAGANAPSWTGGFGSTGEDSAWYG